jgi:release factor glutamine methyltransferase
MVQLHGTDSLQSDTLADLVPRLEAEGYGEFLASFVPTSVRPDAWQRAAAVIDGPLRTVIGLFLLGEAVFPEALPTRIQEMCSTLTRLGFCDEVASGRLRLPGLVLLRLHGYWLFVQRPQISPTLYFGDDSVALANRLRPPAGSRTLDLCAGPGAQSLVCSARSNEVVAVEANPVAAALCQENVSLNLLSDRISIRCGDLYEPVKGVFDYVVCNPPLLPIPKELDYPFVGDGGHDGLAVVRRVVAGLPQYLSGDGACHILGTTPSDGFLPVALTEVEEWTSSYRLDMILTTTAHVDATLGATWTRSVAATVSAHSGCSFDYAHETIANGYARQRATHVCAYYLRIVRGKPNLRVIDVSTNPPSGFWFV